jgi:iron complex outermembrane receptor protein
MIPHRFICLAATLFLLLPLPARAAEDTTGEDTEPMTLKEVRVTATKREGSVKEFPGNLSVIEEGFMEEHEVDTLQDLARFTPNVYIKDTSSGASIVSRGISTIDTSLFSPMGLYVDDVSYSLGYMVNQDLFDVERVEVLRGPQGTLYGRNSESGVINIVLKQPDNERRSKTMFEIGNYASVRAGVSTSGPIVEDSLFYGLTLQGYTTDGFYENVATGDDDVGGTQTFNGRGTLRWTPNKDWDVTVNLDGAKRDLGISKLRFEDGPNKTDRYKVGSVESDKAYETELGQSARVKYAMQGMEFTSVTSHRGFDREHHLDSDRTAMALGVSELDLNMHSWSQEFRLASDNESALSWLAGVYGRYEDIDADFAIDHVNPAMRSSRDGDSEDVGVAGFGQATYEIVPGLRLTGGLRLETYRTEGNETYVSNLGSTSYDDTVEETEVLPMGSLAYDFTSNITAYATVSRGFLSGGFNFYSSSEKENFAYDAEHTTNYEAGLKTNWLDNRLALNATAFYMDITDKQVREEVAGAGLGIWKFTNAAKAHTQGVELEGRYRPMSGLQFIAGFGYARSVVDDWETTSGGTPVDYSGNKVPWAPEYTYNLGVSYQRENGLFIVADLLGTGEQYYDAANELKSDGYETVNLRIGYQREDLDVSVWTKNLLDEEYEVKKVASGGNTLAEDGAPRTYGLTVNWRF